MTDCIISAYAKNAAGYGVIYSPKLKKTFLHHRMAYADYHRLDILSLNGKVVRHTCDNPSCINPEHLVIGTQADNVKDMWTRKRANPGKPIGDSAGGAVLTDELVMAIRKTGGTQEELAKKFGVSRSAISLVQNRKTWKHI